tara:strand:- start:42 stop:587 length:546 start_codon:yes stop_codon:yes gene_type:complete
MKSFDTFFDEVKIIKPEIFHDTRGYFFESFNQAELQQIVNRQIHLIQENNSSSKKNVIRGLHYQVSPFQQAKLIRVIKGEIFDVVVDIRKNSINFGKWVGVTLSEFNKNQIWIPEGFAHGFLTLSDKAEIIYKTNNYYEPKSERTIKWNDPDIDIKWPLNNEPILSERDQKGNFLKQSQLL